MEPRGAGAGEPGLSPPLTGAGEQDASRLRSRPGIEGRRLEISRRVRPQGCRGQEVVLVVGDLLRVLMPVKEGFRQARLLRAMPGRLVRMPMTLQGVRSQPEPLRQGGSGQEKGDGERFAERHARIVAQRPLGVKRPTAGRGCAAAP